MLVYVILVAAIVALFFNKVMGYDRATAYFAALPGGIAEMTAFGIAYGADARTVTLIHSTRILLVTLAVPLGLRFIAGFEPQGVRSLGGGLFTIAPGDAALLLALGVVGFLGARALRIPAPAMIGALVLSAIVHATGLSEARPPGALIALAQLAIGIAIGCQFVGGDPRRIVRTLGVGLGTVGFTLVLAVGIALTLSIGGGHRLNGLILAYAPAGITEMSVVAHALGLDIVFVVTHHMVRIVFLVLLAPLGYRLMPGAKGAGNTTP